MPAITIQITPGGETIIEASGFTGRKCLETAGNLLNALGMPEIQNTLEFNEQTEETSQW